MRCTHCGILITSPQPDGNTIYRYYQSKEYISHSDESSSFLLSFFYKVARKLAIKGKRRLVEKNSSGKTLLDIGCGTGHFLNEMKKAGWQVHGVEPAQIARQKAVIRLEQPIFESLKEMPDIQLSAITLWHVLEHLHHPDETLKLCYNLLQNNGLLLIAVPNYQSYDADYYKNYWAGYDVPRHLWHFNQKSMRMLIEGKGFCIKKVLPMKLDSYYVSLLSEHYKRPKKNAFAKYWCAFRTGTTSNIMAGKTGQYSSLIYLAIKNDETIKS